MICLLINLKFNFDSEVERRSCGELSGQSEILQNLLLTQVNLKASTLTLLQVQVYSKFISSNRL